MQQVLRRGQIKIQMMLRDCNQKAAARKRKRANS